MHSFRNQCNGNIQKKKKKLHTLELKQLDNNKKYYNNMVCPGWTGWLF